MDTEKIKALEEHIKSLRRKLNLSYLILILGFFIMIAFVLFRTNSKSQNLQTGIVYARGLIIRDSIGSNRIILGSPVPTPIEGERLSSESGMIINDTAGIERFGLGLQENGKIVLGLDAPKDRRQSKQGTNNNRC